MYEIQPQVEIYRPSLYSDITTTLYNPFRDNIEELIQYNTMPHGFETTKEKESRAKQEKERQRKYEERKHPVDGLLGQIIKRIIPPSK